MHRAGLILTVVIGLAVPPGLALDTSAASTGGWSGRQPFQGSTGDTIHYYLFTPNGIKSTEKYPLVLWLHGGLKSNGVGGPNMPTDAFYREAHQQENPCFVLRPVAIRGTNWVSPRGAKTGTHTQPDKPAPSMTVLVELLGRVLKRYPIDPGGVHVVGASMGGYGTWDIITRYPAKFASAMPICGGADPAKATSIQGMKIWVFHSADDKIVPVQGSRDMFQALMKAQDEKPTVAEDRQKTAFSSADGGIRYTQYKQGGHNAWDRALREPKLMPWVFADP